MAGGINHSSIFNVKAPRGKERESERERERMVVMVMMMTTETIIGLQCKTSIGALSHYQLQSNAPP